MKKLALLSLLAIVFSSWVMAQNRTIRGKVTDETGAPISGVNIVPTGAKTGVQTDKDGNFTITVSGSPSLTLTHAGYKAATARPASGSDNVNVTLEKEITSNEEVVVIGYSTVKRRDLTGSVSSVGAKQLKDIPVSSAAEALQGKLAGVQVISSEGAPGADVVVRVRGGGSITQDNSPLYIVDGIQVENALSVIAPQDIASVDVLKDASTTAIYGARGANGVVIITTKAGRAGKTQISYNGAYGYRQLPDFMDVMKPYDFVIWQYERTRGSIADSTSFANTYGTTWDTLANYKNVDFINWQDEVFGRKASFQNHNISMSGGSQNTTYNLSLTGNREEGIQITSGFNRNIINFKLDHRVNDKMRVGITTRFLDQTIMGIGTTNSGTRATNRLRHTINYRPFEIPRAGGGIDDFDEAYYLASSGATNPVLLTHAEYRNQKSRALYLTGYASYNIARNLTIRSTFGYDNAYVRSNLFFSKITGTARNFASLPTASIGEQTNSTLSNSNTIQYQVNDFKKHHDITVLIGEETVDRRGSTNTMETRYFPADITADKALANMGLGAAPAGSAQPLPTSFDYVPYRLASFFGRVSYAYDDKYLATFNLRSDRSSKFNPENGTLVFPSGSAAWRFSREKFMDNVKWLNDGKLRIGFGSVGNDRISDLLYLQLYGVTGQYAFNHSILPGLAPSALANPDLRWEKNTTRNIGLDLSMLNNRLQFRTLQKTCSSR
jgi:TonB-linked SusC/RagA family outer membrane protein